MKRFTNHPELWGEFIDVKIWDKIKNPKKYAYKEIFVGSVTDPYNPQEEIYGRTRALLTELQGSGEKLSIATKSDLILRDLDIIQTLPDAHVSCPVNTLDETFKDGMDKPVIMDYIKEQYPALLPLYQEIYNRGSRSYWESLDTELKEYAAESGLEYVANDDGIDRPFDASPVIVNYFCHSEIKKSARKGGDNNA